MSSEDDEKIHQTPLIVIAMKGHPGTGKSTLATAIASSLKIPLIDKDDVRDCTLSLQQTIIHQTTSPQQQQHHHHHNQYHAASSLLNDLSYDVIWQIASTQLKLGISVVLDSPLSRRTHLERLVKLASDARAGLVIVECKDEAEWRRRLEMRGKVGGGDDKPSWHKPSTWRDIERLLEGYGGCTEYDVGDVPKLTVDTTASAGVQELVSNVIDFVCSRCCSGPIKF